MKFIAHRINTIKKLKKIPRNYGVEIDIRSFGKKLILSHDAHKKGEELNKFLKNYKHSLLVANIKEAGIEDKVINEIRKAKIKKYFLLDVEFPYLYKASKKKVKNIAIRFSEDESIQTVSKYINKLNYVWIDTFTKFPINKKNNKILNKFHKCLVSPDRWNRTKEIETYIKIIKRNKIRIDSIMTSYKNIDYWKSLL
jgi:hypothetical protein